MTLERGNGERHGQIGLTGTGGTKAKRDGMRADGIHVALLAERLGANGTTAIRSTSSRSDVASCSPSRKTARQRETSSADSVRPAAASRKYGRKNAPRVDLVRVTAHGDAVATDDHMGTNQTLECTKDTVAGAQNARGVNTLGNGKSNLRGFHEPPCVHGPSRNHRLR